MATTESTARVDLHCHSEASQLSRLGVQRALGLPECATPPEEVYALAKRRGMDFVTITDHDTIDGVMSLADLPDVFLSEELTATFKGEGQAVHVLCYGITPSDHEWLQEHRDDLEACAEYLSGNEIVCALAHPFYAVQAPLLARHRQRLAELFPIWEVRNGSRARELNMPASIWIETRGGIGIAGSDDHAGIDIGRTFTETPAAGTPSEFLGHIRAGRAVARGEHGSAAKWAHAAITLAARVADGALDVPPADAVTTLRIIERLMHDADLRQDAGGPALDRADGMRLLRAWLESVDVDPSARGFLEMVTADEFRHADLQRRAHRTHERRLRDAVSRGLAKAGQASSYAETATDLFEACLPAIPYAPASAFLARERAKLSSQHGDALRVALIAEGIGSMHGLTHTIAQIRERGVPGFEVDVIGTDPNVDRRLPAATEAEVPFYDGLRVGVPSLPALVDAFTEGRYDVAHVCSPGPGAVGAMLVAKMMGLPTVGSYHTELSVYAGLRTGDESVGAAIDNALSTMYRSCDVVLSPSLAADRSLATIGVERERVRRWERGVDVERFSPALRDRGDRDRLEVLYAGRLSVEKGVRLLATAYLRAQRLEQRLHLVLAGGGPEEEWLRERLGGRATFLGWLEGDELPRTYANADVFLFPSRTDTFGQVVLEAHASGLPVIAVGEGGPASLVRDDIDGRLCTPRAESLAAALVDLAASAPLRRRLARGAIESVRNRTWERALEQLANGYELALADRGGTQRAPSAA